MRTERSADAQVASRRVVAACAALWCAVQMGCGGDSTGPRVPATLEAVGTTSVAGTVNTVLAGPFSVRVLDSRKRGMKGVSAACRVESGGGSVAIAAPVSIADGTVSCGAWTLGTRAGAQILAVTVGTLPAVRFTATTAPGVPTHFVVIGSVPATIRSGVAIEPPLALQVRDAFENDAKPAGVAVVIAVSGATVTGNAVVTDNSGRATFTALRINGIAGARTLTLTSNASAIVPPAPVVFALTAGVAATVAIAQGMPALVTTGAIVAPAPRVQLRDGDGNDVAQSGVVISATASAATTAGATATTDAQGVATFAALSLAGTPGSQTMSFGGTGLAAQTTSAFQLVEVAALLSLDTGVPSVIQTGVIIAPTPVVAVRGTLGTLVPVAGTVVTASTTTPGVTLSGTTATTDATGRARFTSLMATGAPNAIVIAFQSAGLPEVSTGSVTLQNAPADPNAASIEFGTGTAKVIVVDPAQSVQAPAVVVRNVSGAVLPAAPVTFSVRSPASASIAADGTITGIETGRTAIVASPTGAAAFTDSVIVHVTRAAGAPLLRTDLTALSITVGVDFDVRVFFDARTAGPLTAVTLDVAYPRNSPTLLSLLSVTPTANTSFVASPTAGLVRLVYVNATGEGGLVELARLRFRPFLGAPAFSQLVLTPLQVVSAGFQDLTGVTTPINPLFVVRQ